MVHPGTTLFPSSFRIACWYISNLSGCVLTFCSLLVGPSRVGGIKTGSNPRVARVGGVKTGSNPSGGAGDRIQSLVDGAPVFRPFLAFKKNPK